MGANKICRTQSSKSEEDEHKHEGFFKSMWHNLTNHPAHQKKSDPDPAAKDPSGDASTDGKDPKDSSKP